jgi:hypothetical protein
LDAGKSAQLFEDSVVEVGAVFVFAPGVALKKDVGGCDVVGGEAFIEGGEMNQAFCEESGDEQKSGAGEDLRCNQPAS